jgi:hypothetical protein
VDGKIARSRTQARKLGSREEDEESGISDDHMSIFYYHMSIFSDSIELSLQKR